MCFHFSENRNRKSDLLLRVMYTLVCYCNYSLTRKYKMSCMSFVSDLSLWKSGNPCCILVARTKIFYHFHVVDSN